ncbi:MAG: low molecular weight protein-tyrosine-phosphatase [Phycisphaerales bacterium JB060]
MTRVPKGADASVLFVCLGNICRSPTAEGVFRSMLEEAGVADRVFVDSAGTGAWHVGKAPDARAQAAARRRGVDLSGLRARQVEADDLDAFDFVLAMDGANLAALEAMRPGKAMRMLVFAPEAGTLDVPDPYYGGDAAFDAVLDLLTAASRGLLDRVRDELDAR